MIKDQQRDRMAALTEQAEKMCAAENARNDAIRKRLGRSVQPVPLPSPQSPVQRARPSLHGRRLRPLVRVPCFNVEDMDRNKRSPTKEDDSFREKVLFGSQTAGAACRRTPMSERPHSLIASSSGASSLSCVDSYTPREQRAISLIRGPTEFATFNEMSLSSIDSHTPRELRAIPLITSPTEFATLRATPHRPPVALRSRHGVSRLPVLAVRLKEGKFLYRRACLGMSFIHRKLC